MFQRGPGIEYPIIQDSLIRLLRRSRWQRLDRPGGHAPDAWLHQRDDDLCVSKRSGKRDAARGSCHGEHEKRNANWSDRCAVYMVAEQVGTELLM
jgi:hypothetical protein